MDKQIEEMAEDIRLIKELQASNIYTPNYQEAMALISLGYQKCKDKVVLSKEEYEDLKYKESLLSKTALITKEEFLMLHDNCKQARKQAVKEFIQALNKEYELFDDEDEIFFSCLREDIKKIAKEKFGVEEPCQEEESIIDVWCERKRRETNQND